MTAKIDKQKQFCNVILVKSRGTRFYQNYGLMEKPSNHSHSCTFFLEFFKYRFNFAKNSNGNAASVLTSRWLWVRFWPWLLCVGSLQVFQVLPTCPGFARWAISATLNLAGCYRSFWLALWWTGCGPAFPTTHQGQAPSSILTLSGDRKRTDGFNVCITASLHHPHQRVEGWTAKGNFLLQVTWRVAVDPWTSSLHLPSPFAGRPNLLSLCDNLSNEIFVFFFFTFTENAGNISEVAHIWWRSCTIGKRCLSTVSDEGINSESKAEASHSMVGGTHSILVRRKRKRALDRCNDTHV